MKRDPVETCRMREAVKAAAVLRGDITHVPRIGPLDVCTFRAFAEAGVPFVIVGLVEHWPLSHLTVEELGKRFGHLQVKARVGDYVGKAFSKAREFVEMSLAAYLALMSPTRGVDHLPPYLGNQALPELAALCRWPPYFERYRAAKVWLGPAGTVTPLHCDFTDNLFAQLIGNKRFLICAPHHDAALKTREANEVLYASRFDPAAPDFDRFPEARGVPWLDVTVQAGELLYLPAGWFHRVEAMEFSLSANRWTDDRPMVLMRSEAPRAQRVQ